MKLYCEIFIREKNQFQLNNRLRETKQAAFVTFSSLIHYFIFSMQSVSLRQLKAIKG